MKSLFALVAVTLLGVGIAACGGSREIVGSPPQTSSHTAKTASTTSTASIAPAPVETKVDGDKDNDIEAPYDDRNNSRVLDYGHPASPSDKQAVTVLIKRYYAAALAGNGRKACSMIYSTLAEAVPEDYGESAAGPPYMRGGKTCAAVLTLMFKHFHRQFALGIPLLKVSRVRLIEHRGLAVLSFGKLPERQIPVGREGRAWKVTALLDNELP